MSDKLVEQLTAVNLATVVAIIIALAILAKFLAPHAKKLKETIIEHNDEKRRDKKLVEDVKNVKSRMKTYETNRLHDREQSFKIQKELVDSIKRLSDKIDKLDKDTKERFLQDRERNDKRVRAELKDKISCSYRYYHKRGKWNDMEKESLIDLIREYEAHGGDNSFVHKVVEKEMYTWGLIERE